VVDLEPIPLGRYPTPVFRVESLSTDEAELWVKNDGVIAEPYGGNKIRKLELILADAAKRGARRILTTGAGGSHHVLATALFARRIGIPVAAVLCPQPWTAHAAQTLRASLGAGVEPVVTGSMVSVPFAMARARRRGDYLVPAGGSSVLGTLGYLRAVGELVEQIRAGALPEPDVIIAPLGSGGTVAGILAGTLREGLPCRVVGVDVAVAPALARAMVLGLARLATRADAGSAGVRRLARALEVDGAHLGGGYGHPTRRGAEASRVAAEIGLGLDPTYTAKTFARALEELSVTGADGSHPRRVLYWHTLSAAPMEPLLRDAPNSLPPDLAVLLPSAASGNQA